MPFSQTDPDESFLIRNPALRPLRHRDFRLFWGGACLSFMGSWVQAIAMGLFVYQLTGSKQWLGVIGLAGGLPTTFFMLFGGAVADRGNRRAIVMTTQAIFGLTALALAILTWTHTIQVWHIVVLSFVNGGVAAIDGPARQSMVYDLVGREELATGVALQSAAFNIARVVGPAVGSIIYAAMGPGWCFFINALSFAAIILAVMAIHTDLSSHSTATESVWSGIMEGLRHIRTNKPMRSVVMLTGMTSLFAFSCYSTLMPAFAKDMLNITDRNPHYGLLFSAIGAGAIVGVYQIGRSTVNGHRGRMVVGGAFVFSITLLLLSHVYSFWPAILLFFVLGLSAIGQFATANTLTQSLAPDELRGRAVSLHMFATGGLHPFGAMLAGAVAQAYGVPVALTFGASVLLVYTVVTTIQRPETARLP